MTAKAKDLWKAMPESGVTEEDVKHMKKRVLCFPCVGEIADELQRAIEPCGCCMAKWMVEGAAAADAAAALRHQVNAAGGGGGEDAEGDPVQGFMDVVRQAVLPHDIGQALHGEAVALGAVHVSELTPADWQGLPSWPTLRPLQQRRLMNLLG